MNRKFIISGGGTGGHIFPALSIANEIRKRDPDADILFVGASGRMEMERVPAAGYPIIGLPVEGIQRKIGFRNILVIFKLIISLFKANHIIKSFHPNVVVGVGGYASGPLLRIAAGYGIPTVIQEQNSYAGITNRWLSRKASRICVAYPDMNKYFPSDKIVLTGNPVREELVNAHISRTQACEYLHIHPGNSVLLVIGGSLGAKTINHSMMRHIQRIEKLNIHLYWQTGSLYFSAIKEEIDRLNLKNITCVNFIERMDMAYAAADVIISRAGAATISEICILGKPSILVPSPNVAEDHQTKNAMVLVRNDAALMITDKEAPDKLMDQAFELLNNQQVKSTLGMNCKKMALPGAAVRITDEIFALSDKK
jgi:UDP-N-acetylglucosamine--N-acetylmuramyl-(pentapeptide) pyrophosphoryl-undecaprenol N-acetylglucosamine transferase